VLKHKGMQMNGIRGPAVDPEAFRVEGHCCGIRLPVLQTLADEGLRFEFTPQLRAESMQKGMSLPGEAGAPADPGQREQLAADSPGDR
jgi:hypothetical protein